MNEKKPEKLFFWLPVAGYLVAPTDYILAQPCVVASLATKDAQILALVEAVERLAQVRPPRHGDRVGCAVETLRALREHVQVFWMLAFLAVELPLMPLRIVWGWRAPASPWFVWRSR